ncbi:putative mitochondrial protein [Dendrobium catenatum]|uniref:Putative mitochondrial protein n=1 Tax=Dendrobium catenatum TaxID=906689 RepID=A0A2I0VHM2_9ASPA|nr:putative mitochondrial protein [Dendrobium catenatum]
MGVSIEVNLSVEECGKDLDVSLYIVSQSLYSYVLCWISNTDATYHIYPTREWFSIYRELDSGVVTKGYKVVIEEEVLKIYHGALVYLNGVLYHNLYYLQGRIVMGLAIVVDDSSNATALWHIWFAHVGEASIMTLVKK